MIDFDREEFLARLDIRINAISNLIWGLENILLKDMPRKDYNEATRKTEKFHQLVLQQLHNLDQQTQERFAKFKEKIAKENCDNE
jgi:hypothetical protein